MAQVYLSIGTNINREENIENGVSAIERLFGPLTLSSLFESEAVGFDGSPFFNMVIGFDTSFSLEALHDKLREIEFTFGRDLHAKKFSPRTLDIDILLYDDLIISEPAQLPRDEILFNAFVLCPLAEVAEELVHPIEKQSYQLLWQNFDKTKQPLTKIPFTWTNSTEVNK